MNTRKIVLLTLFALICFMSICAQETAEISVDVNKTENRISDKLYGFLLEHLYHSISNGVWGENVWNRSFEDLFADGDWCVGNDKKITLDAKDRQLAYFRIGQGKDYEFSVDVKRIDGNGPILIGVRDQLRDSMMTNRIYLFLGEKDSHSCRLELSTGWIWYSPTVNTKNESYSADLSNNKWIKVRIRCSGDSITGWVNEYKIFCRAVENCPMSGFITIGGQDCRAQFRNVVVSPIGSQLVDVNINLARHWNFIGDGTIMVDHNDVLNDKTALKILSNGHFVGIEQGNYSVRKEDPLCGSLFLKGGVSKIYVRLLDGKDVLAEQTIEGITEHWHEFHLRLPSDRNVASATLQIYAKEKGIIKIDQVSLMYQSSVKNEGFNVELTNAVKAIKPTILRWPGGSFSEQYRFENGLGQQKERKGILRWDDFDPLSFGTDEFLAFCHKVGAEPQIVVPIGYHNYAGYAPNKGGKQDWLQRALDWMDYCNGDTNTTVWGGIRARNGHKEPYKIKLWEIDNEVWKMNPKIYAEIARHFSIEMKRKYPYVKIIGCGCGRLGNEGVGLDSVMINDMGEYFDYISPHYYQTINKYDNDGVEEYGRYLDKLSGWISRSKNPSMKIYLSEWNLDGTDMRTGLFAGGFMNRLERTPTVEMAASALFLRHTSANGWNNAFINFNQNGWFPAPNYVVLKLWRDYFLPRNVGITGDVKGLNIIATASDDNRQVCLKIVNPTSKTIKLKVKGINGFHSPVWHVVNAMSLTDANTMELPDKIKVKEFDIAAYDDSVEINIPKYSASVLSFNKEQKQ